MALACAVKLVTLRLPNALTGSDVCINGAPQIHRVTVKLTLVSVKVGDIAHTLVTDTSGPTLSLQHGVYLC